MTESKTLFVQFEPSAWTEDQLENAMDVMDDAFGDDIEVVALADDIEFMSQEQLDDLIQTLIEVSEEVRSDAED